MSLRTPKIDPLRWFELISRRRRRHPLKYVAPQKKNGAKKALLDKVPIV